MQDIYGPYSKCTICLDFDFCFKCLASAKQSHPPHDFETIEEGFTGHNEQELLSQSRLDHFRWAFPELKLILKQQFQPIQQ